MLCFAMYVLDGLYSGRKSSMSTIGEQQSDAIPMTYGYIYNRILNNLPSVSYSGIGQGSMFTFNA